MEWVVRRWGRLVRNLVDHWFPRGGGQKDAVDLVFETVAKKWLKYQVFDDVRLVYKLDIMFTPEHQIGSLTDICKNVCRDLWRKKERRDEPLMSLEEVGADDRAHPRMSTDPLLELEAEETRAIVEAAISTAPPAKAAIARASIFEGMTVDEIAERFGWDPNSVRSALSFVRRIIEVALERNK
jgi:RNA polymerase sigma factor (sigma-70 family)